MTKPDLHDDLRRTLNDVGASIQGDGNILFTNIGQLSEVVAVFARRAVVEQQKRCETVCLRAAQSNDQSDPKLATALRECASEIGQLGH